MFNAKFISNCVSENIDDIKIAALYYDKVEILRNKVYTLTKPQMEVMKGKKCLTARIRGAYDCVTDDFIESLKIMEEENIISYSDIEEYSLSPINSDDVTNDIPELMKSTLKESIKLITENEDALWQKDKSTNNFGFNPEVKHIHEVFVNEFKVGSAIDFEFIYIYYRNLLSYFLYNISLGENTLTSSSILDNYIKNFYLDNLNKYKNKEINFGNTSIPNIATEAIKLMLPNVAYMPIDDILEIRYKLNDELQRFRYSCLKLNQEIHEVFDEREIISNIQKCLNLALKPAVDDLTDKIKGTKLNIASKFLDQVRDLKTYTPFLGSVFLNIPAHLSALLSVTLIGTKISLESYKEIMDIKNNGLYFMIKLRKYNPIP